MCRGHRAHAGPRAPSSHSKTSLPARACSPQIWDLTPEDKQAYCFWSGQIYSLGASFCSRQQSLLTCTEWPGKRPIWVIKDNDKNCDRNPSQTLL